MSQVGSAVWGKIDSIPAAEVLACTLILLSTVWGRKNDKPGLWKTNSNVVPLILKSQHNLMLHQYILMECTAMPFTINKAVQRGTLHFYMSPQQYISVRRQRRHNWACPWFYHFCLQLQKLGEASRGMWPSVTFTDKGIATGYQMSGSY